MLEENTENRAHCRGVNKPEARSPHDFEQPIDAFGRNGRPKCSLDKYLAVLPHEL